MVRSQLVDLSTALSEQLSGAAQDWLTTALEQLTRSAGGDCTEIHLRCSAMARRKLGTAPLEQLTDPCCWQADEAGRLLLLAKRLAQSTPQEAAALIKEAFKYGDEYEQIAIIKGLEWIDDRGDMTDLAIATGRTNSINVFAAIALNNPYPARFYDDRAFHQLVLKTLFMDLHLACLLGLQQRLSARLSTLCIDLVNERLAAERNPPVSIWLAIDLNDLNAADQATYLKFTKNNKGLL
jgi:hypothetical protein